MMNLSGRRTRGVALLAGGAVAALALMPATARADDTSKEKAYKYGAIGLGVASALLLLKGKNVAGAAVGAGAYYAYKKSQDIKEENRYSRDDRYSQYPGNYDYRNDDYRNNDYRNNDYRNNDYRNNDYRNNDYRNDNYRYNDNSRYEGGRYRNDYRNDYRSDYRSGTRLK